MSNTIDVETNPLALAVAPAATRSVQAAAPSQPESYESLMALAKDLCATGFLPAAVKTPAQAVAIILTGKELGLGPMQSLRSICIIQGKPELAADLQLSIFHRDGGRSKWLELTDSAARLWLRHPNGDEHTETFTMLDAKRAGLTGQNWQKYPKAMLRSRAITAGLKSIGFEPLASAYAPGEIGGPEIVGPEPETVPPEPPLSAPATDSAATPPPAKAAPAPALKLATAATREWMERGLAAMEGLAVEYFQKLTNPAVLMPGEGLKDLPWQWIPITSAQLKSLQDAITEFGNGANAKHPYSPNPVAEVAKPKTAKTAPKPKAEPQPARSSLSSVQMKIAELRKKAEWFWPVIIPVPHKGMKKADYDKKPDTIEGLYTAVKEGDQAAQARLFGLAKKWNPEPREWNGKIYQPTDADHICRAALDDFADWEEKHRSDAQPDPEDEQDDIPF